MPVKKIVFMFLWWWWWVTLGSYCADSDVLSSPLLHVSDIVLNWSQLCSEDSPRLRLIGLFDTIYEVLSTDVISTTLSLTSISYIGEQHFTINSRKLSSHSASTNTAAFQPMTYKYSSSVKNYCLLKRGGGARTLNSIIFSKLSEVVFWIKFYLLWWLDFNTTPG